jgi:DNA-3-methyladenine glycosylase I
MQAFMQACGLVNHHVDGCFARREVERARAAFRRPGAPR